MPYRVSLISRSGYFKAVCTLRDAGIDVLITRRSARLDSKNKSDEPRWVWAQSGRYLIPDRPWHVVMDAVYATMREI